MKTYLIILLLLIVGCTYCSEMIIEGKDVRYGFIRGKDIRAKRTTCFGNCEQKSTNVNWQD